MKQHSNALMSLINSKEFKTRTLSAMFLVIFSIISIIKGGYFYTWTICIIVMVLATEWEMMIRNIANKKTPLNKLRIFGAAYILIPAASLLFIRNHEYGLELTFWMLITIVCSDTGAYMTGIVIGGPKLAPKISPKKTWSGLFGGVAFASIFGFLFWTLSSNTENFGILTPLLSIVAQSGDLFESYLKRKFKVKDSGKLIPGHGGLFDRMDSVLTSAIFVALVIL